MQLADIQDEQQSWEKTFLTCGLVTKAPTECHPLNSPDTALYCVIPDISSGNPKPCTCSEPYTLDIHLTLCSVTIGISSGNLPPASTCAGNNEIKQWLQEGDLKILKGLNRRREHR